MGSCAILPAHIVLLSLEIWGFEESPSSGGDLEKGRSSKRWWPELGIHVARVYIGGGCFFWLCSILFLGAYNLMFMIPVQFVGQFGWLFKVTFFGDN
jgi:hypothetical protein